MEEEKEIILKFRGLGALITPAITAFCLQGGYDSESEMTEIEFAKKRISDYVRSEVAAYNSKMAAIAASEAAQSATVEAMDLITMTAEIVDV